MTMSKESISQSVNAVKNEGLTDAHDHVIVALDFPTVDQAKSFVIAMDESVNRPMFYKVGMELFYASGREFVYWLKVRGHRVFLDLKLHDIPNTVHRAAQQLSEMGADMFSVHASGGREMMEAALEGIEKGLQLNGGRIRPMLVAITLLTSINQAILNDEIGIAGSVEQGVLRLAELVKHSGLSGVVCSPLEVQQLKAHLGRDFLTVTPGIRMSSRDAADQKRITTPRKAIEIGSDYLVIGRAISQAADPYEAYLHLFD